MVCHPVGDAFLTTLDHIEGRYQSVREGEGGKREMQDILVDTYSNQSFQWHCCFVTELLLFVWLASVLKSPLDKLPSSTIHLYL